MRFVPTYLLASTLILSASIASYADEPAEVIATSAAFQAFLTKHCLECHSGAEPKGELRIDRLASDSFQVTDQQRWVTILKRIASGEMPPADKPRPTADEITAVTQWIEASIKAADLARRKLEGRVVRRRLNRIEYENTVRDLLQIDVELQELLAMDSSQDGFDNVGDALHLSSFAMERYLEAADLALNVAIANGPQPALIKKRYSLEETHQVKATTEKVFRHFGAGGVVMFSSSAWQSVSISPFYPPDRGKYRFRISSSGVQSDKKPVTYRVDAGIMLMTGKPHLVGYFDAAPDKAEVVEFVDFLEPRGTIRISPVNLASAQAVDKIGADKYEGPGLAVDWVEVEGPLHDTWPPKSHRLIFGDLPQTPALNYNQSDRVEVTSTDPLVDAERILAAFTRRAFRRPVAESEVQAYLALVERALSQKRTFEQAMRVGLTGVLVSPEFLFLRETSGQLDSFALASRLSYFFWSTMPDDELFALAEANQLQKPEVLRQQVERMLNDPRAESFTKNFVGQWLGLRDIDFTMPSPQLYPEFDDMLKASMVRETELFFAQLLKEDLSIMNFVDSDFTMLNGRLAKHYGIPGIEGWALQKVSLPADSHRGGVLTMASVLKVTANGTTTSPVMRGAWVLDRILGTPPPRPPENIAALEPDVRGATTIREQLAKHRQTESCASCHRLMDPPGFALESFDVIGGWRQRYRQTGWSREAKEVVLDGRKMPYYDGPLVDPADRLVDGRSFQNIDEFKQLLLTDKDQIARSLTTKLITYATGGAPTLTDKQQIETIVAHLREKNYGLRALVHEIVASSLFQEK